MENWVEVVRAELKDYCLSENSRSLSLPEIHDAVLPALEREFPQATAYSNHLNSALEELARRGEIKPLSSGSFRIEFDEVVNGIDSSTSTTSQSSSSTQKSSGSTQSTSSDHSTESHTPKADGSELETKSLYELLRSCQMGEAGAIVGGHIDRNELRKELYIETPEDRVVTDFFVDDYEEDGKHLIITGSAGDGKSALLSRAFRLAQEEDQGVEPEHIHMDATASRGKHETYDETLSDFLNAVSTCLEQEAGPRTGLAINLGLAIDFFERQNYRGEYEEVWEAIDGARNSARHETDRIVVLNLSHRSTYNTDPDNLGAGLLEELVEKFAFEDSDSPFNAAYKRHEERCLAPDECPLYYNARQFARPEIRDRVVELIAASGLINNVYLNPRAILDVISKMIVPEAMQSVADSADGCPVGRSTTYNKKFESDVLIWNAIFERLSQHEDTAVGYLDPTAQAEKRTDEEILTWSAGPEALTNVLADTPIIEEKPLVEQTRTALRRQYLTGDSTIKTARDWSWFTEFTGALSFFDPPNGEDGSEHSKAASTTVETVTQALKGWTGQANKGEDWVEFVDGVEGEFKFLSKWEKPTPDIEACREETRQETIPGQLWVVLEPGGHDLQIPVPVTFELYLLMKRISRGYRPNSRDLERSEGIRLIHSRLSEFTDKKDTIRIDDKSDEPVLRLDRDAFGQIQIDVGGEA